MGERAIQRVFRPLSPTYAGAKAELSMEFGRGVTAFSCGHATREV